MSQNNMSLIIHKDALEPEEFFTVLKNGNQNTSTAKLTTQLHYLAAKIRDAKMVGQTRFVERGMFLGDVIMRELVLAENGINRYVSREIIKDIHIKVRPKNSVKIIELERYPRMIPESSIRDIQYAQDLGVFDDFLVMFTDLTNERYESKEDKDFVARNRDPIVFGVFKQEGGEGNLHDRMYFITDWADEHCELTFEQLLNDIDDDHYGIIADTPKQIIDDLLNNTTDAVIVDEDTHEDAKTQNMSLYKRFVRLIKG